MTKVDIGIDLSEIEELRRVIMRLNEAAQKRVFNNMAAAGARVVAKQFSRNAPAKALEKTGVLSARKAAKHLNISYRDAVGLGFAGFASPRLAHLFEFGTQERFTKTGASRGRMPMRPFMRPAMDSSNALMLKKMAEIGAKGLAREAEKARKGGY